MKLRRLLFLVPVCCACATGSATEKKAVSKPLGSYPSAAVVVVAADPSSTNAAQKVGACRTALEAKLNAAGIWGSVLGEAAQADAALLVKASLTDETQSMLGVEEKHKKLLLAVDLIDAKDQSSVGALDVRGTSETSGSVSVGGVDTDAFADLYKRACDVAGDQLVAFLQTKK